jgi:hypothetical protein
MLFRHVCRVLGMGQMHDGESGKPFAPLGDGHGFGRLLSRLADCRIWMDKRSVDIVETLFSEHGIPAPDTSVIIKPPPAQE